MADNFFGGAHAGATSASIDVLIRKLTDNTALTGLAFGTAGNIASYHRQGAVRAAIALVTQTVAGAFSSGGFIEIDATNQPGLYRLDVPDAAWAAGADYVTISFVTTSGHVYHERIAIFTGAIVSLGATAKTDVKQQITDALNVDTYVELVGVPASTTTLRSMLQWLFAAKTNKQTQTATTQTLRNRADLATLATAAWSDDGTTTTKGADV